MPRSSDRGGDRLASDNSDEPETGNQTNSVPSATHAGVPHVVCRPATGLPTVTPRFSVCFASFE